MLSNIADMSVYQIIAELVEIPFRVIGLFIIWDRFVPLFTGESKNNKKKVLVLAVIVAVTEVLRWCVFTNGFPFWMITMCGIPLIYAYTYKKERIPETFFH